MTRVYAVVEGDSEEAFLTRVVQPHLAAHSVWLHPMKVLRGKTRGGGRSWQPWQRHLNRLLAEHRGLDVRVTTMLDLYAIPNDCPGWTTPGSAPGAQRADAIIDAMRASTADDRDRLLPYVQVHEFEAFLFVDLSVIERQSPDLVDRVLFAEMAKQTSAKKPEDINDSAQSAPSKRIEDCTLGFRKSIHGVQAIEAIGLNRLRQECPRFDTWVAWLEQLRETTASVCE